MGNNHINTLQSGNATLGDLSEQKVNLEASVENAQNAIDSIQSGNNELIMAAEENFQNSIEEFNAALDYCDEIDGQAEANLQALDENIGQEVENMELNRTNLKNIDADLSAQTELIGKLGKAIDSYTSNIEDLNTMLRNIDDRDAASQIEKSIAVYQGLISQAEDNKRKAEERQNKLVEERNLISDAISRSEV